MENENITSPIMRIPEVSQSSGIYDQPHWINTTCGQPLCIGMNVKGDLIPLIHPYWKQFPMPSESLNVVLGSIYMIIAVVGFVGNSVILVIFVRCSRVRVKPSNLLVANLALADLLMMIKTPFFAVNSFMQFPYFGRIGCEIYGSVSLMAGLAAIWFLAGISYDRYHTFHHSLNIHKRVTWKQTRCFAFFIWALSASCSSMPFLGWNRYIPEGYLAGCTIDYLSRTLAARLYVLFLLVVAWLLPMIIICYTYCYIGIQIYAVKKDLNNMVSSTRDSKLYSKREVRVIRTISLLVLMWTVSWTPYAMVALMGNLNLVDSNLVTPLVATLAGLFGKTSACVNPYIYGILLPSFRKEIDRNLEKNIGLPMKTTVQPKRITFRRYQSIVRFISSENCITHNRERTENEIYSPDHHNNRIFQQLNNGSTRAKRMNSHDQVAEDHPDDEMFKNKSQLQRFLLPDGEITIAPSYSAAKRNKKQKVRKNTLPALRSVDGSDHSV